MTEFLVRLYDRWREHGDETIRIRELEAVRRRVRDESAGYCRLAGGCLGTYYIVEPDGAVAHCDLFLGDPAYELGDVGRRVRRHPGFGGHGATWRARRAEDLAAMEQLPRVRDLQGGCPHERYLAVRHDPRFRPECCGHAELIAHVRAGEAGAPTAPPRSGAPSPRRSHAGDLGRRR